ncbi:MAG: FAD-dependent oxidoreductase [Thermodesulfovibrionia bacterium]|nr:FAD-dependent oxidoreductase [Thermodesulfovibrionia bacterium]
MSEKSIVIIGAGIAGLTLAYHLLESGIKHPVVLVEKEENAGGLGRSFAYTHNSDRFVFDIGPHRFHSDDQAVNDFVLKILGDDYIEIDRSSSVWMFDRYHDWPLNINSVLKLPFMLMLRSTSDMLLRKKAKSESFEDFIIEKYGKSIYMVFFKPYTEKFMKYDCSELHSDWAKAGINRSVNDKRIKIDSLLQLVKSTLMPKPVDTKFIYPKSGGIDVFCKILEEKIKEMGGRILLSSTVTGIESGGNKIESLIVNNAEKIETCQLFWSAPIPVLLDLLHLDDKLPDLEYLAVVLANYLIDASPEKLFQWCYFGTYEAPVSRIAMPAMFNPDLAPKGKSGLCVELTCMEGDGLWKHPERMKIIIEEFLLKVRLVPKLSDFIDVKFERIPNTYPIYTLDYPGKYKLILDALRNYRNLLNFGRTGGFWYNNMDHSIAQAMEIAKTCMKDPDRFEPAAFKYERDFTKS